MNIVSEDSGQWAAASRVPKPKPTFAGEWILGKYRHINNDEVLPEKTGRTRRLRKGARAELLATLIGLEISVRKPKSLTRSRTQAGSAVLEAALVFLPLMAIFFAMIDVPFAIFKQNTLREAVREGVRFAITQQTGAGGQDAAILTLVKSYSMGFLNDSDISAGKATFAINYYDGASLNAVNGVGSNAAGNICVITASVQHYWIAPVWRGTGALVFNAASSDVMEAPPSGILPGR